MQNIMAVRFPNKKETALVDSFSLLAKLVAYCLSGRCAGGSWMMFAISGRCLYA